MWILCSRDRHFLSMASLNVTIRVRGLENFRRMLGGGTSAVITKILNQWTFVYLGFIQRRFVGASGGDGTWPPLSPATIARRRKGKNPGTVRILRDTSTLFNALTPGTPMPGGIRIEDGFSVLLGYGGGAGHPNSHHATIAQIANFHQVGGGHLPQRKIIVEPDESTLRIMTDFAETELQDALNVAVANGH